MGGAGGNGLERVRLREGRHQAFCTVALGEWWCVYRPHTEPATRSQIPDLKPSSHLNLPNSWDYGHTAPSSALQCYICFPLCLECPFRLGKLQDSAQMSLRAAIPDPTDRMSRLVICHGTLFTPLLQLIELSFTQRLNNSNIPTCCLRITSTWHGAQYI